MAPAARGVRRAAGVKRRRPVARGRAQGQPAGRRAPPPRPGAPSQGHRSKRRRIFLESNMPPRLHDALHCGEHVQGSSHKRPSESTLGNNVLLAGACVCQLCPGPGELFRWISLRRPCPAHCAQPGGHYAATRMWEECKVASAVKAVSVHDLLAAMAMAQ